MLNILISITGILLTIFFVIVTHEFGHFMVARLAGVKVLHFSIGFGKKLFSWHDKKGTKFIVAAIPLGGYVKMLDETESDEPLANEDLPYAYNRQPHYKKLAIVAAGPLTNLVCAFLVYWFLFVVGFTSITPLIGKILPNSPAATAGMQAQQEITHIDDKPTSSWAPIVIHLLAHVGDTDHIKITTKPINVDKTQTYLVDATHWKMDDLQPDPLSSLGIQPYEPEIPLVIGKISENSPAATLLRINDKIIAINNKTISDWYSLAAEIDANPERIVMLKIERDKKILTIPITTSYQRDLFFKKHGMLGIAPHYQLPKFLLKQNQYSPLAAFTQAWYSVNDLFILNYLTLEKLVTGKISIKSLGGPITIFGSAGSSLNQGWVPFLGFLAFLSVAIGFVNLLPIPGLDGGHILFQCIEIIIRRPIPMRWQILFFRLGFILLLLLVTQAIVNDIARL